MTNEKNFVLVIVDRWGEDCAVYGPYTLEVVTRWHGWFNDHCDNSYFHAHSMPMEEAGWHLKEMYQAQGHSE